MIIDFHSVKAVAAALWLSLLLSGCASLSKEECLSADWRLIGFEDGSRGHSMQTIGAHRKACAKVGVTPDLNAYEEGHLKGVQSYCTAPRGFSLGVRGGSYNGICAVVADEKSFVDAFNIGKERYVAQQNVKHIAAQVKQLEEHLVQIDEDIETHEQLLVSGEGTLEERKEHLEATKVLHGEAADVVIELEQANRELDRASVSLQRLLQHQKQLGYE